MAKGINKETRGGEVSCYKKKKKTGSYQRMKEVFRTHSPPSTKKVGGGGRENAKKLV